MLDSDLAKLYGCTNGTKDINKAAKRNIERFPKDFYFQLTNEEFTNLKFQNGTSSSNNYGGVRKLPFVFMEQGVAMLSSVLRTPNAAEVSISIMRVFVAMRHFIIENQEVFKSIADINHELRMHNNHLTLLDNRVDELFSEFKTKDLTEKTFFESQIFDAYSKLMDIMNMAKEELIIIDNYADKTVLDMISKIKVNVTLIVKSKTILKELDIKKYNEQYHNLNVIFNDSFHDRYIVIDKKAIYHCGASLNKAGSKIFSINKLEDIDILDAFY